MIDEARIQSVLSRMASEIRQHRQVPAGWGQFLNLPREHPQVGPYGTAAGILVSSIASPTPDLRTQDKDLVKKFWHDWKNKYNRTGRKFIQNTRLAFYYLALRFSGQDDLSTLADELATELLRRQLSNDLWGSWFISEHDKDDTESIFVSSIIVLSFCLPWRGSVVIPPAIVRAATVLQERARTDKNLSHLELISSLAAIVWALRSADVNNSIKKEVTRQTRDVQTIQRPNLYFFDFQYIDNGKRIFGRDYFVIPGGVFEVLMVRNGYCHYLDALARERLLNHLMGIVENFRGKFLTHGETLIATVNQAWVALAFHVGRIDRADAVPIRYRFVDWLGKPRPDTVFWRLVMPIGVLCILIVGTLEPRVVTIWVPGQLEQFLTDHAPPAPALGDLQQSPLDGVDWFVKLVMALITVLWAAGFGQTVRAKINSLFHRD